MQPQQQLAKFIQSIFAMADDECNAIVANFTYKEIDKQCVLLKRGKVCNEYYFLLEGVVRSYTQDIDGNDVTTGIFTPDKVVCELFSFFKRQPSQESIETATPCKLLVIDFDGLQNVFHSMPMFREFGRQILINAYAIQKQRMYGMLQQTAEQRYLHLLQTEPVIFQTIPLKQIASYLGITNTSLSRIRKEFAKS